MKRKVIIRFDFDPAEFPDVPNTVEGITNYFQELISAYVGGIMFPDRYSVEVVPGDTYERRCLPSLSKVAEGAGILAERVKEAGRRGRRKK